MNEDVFTLVLERFEQALGSRMFIDANLQLRGWDPANRDLRHTIRLLQVAYPEREQLPAFMALGLRAYNHAMDRSLIGFAIGIERVLENGTYKRKSDCQDE